MSATGGQIAFVDTNVLAYAHDMSDAARQPVATNLLRDLWLTRSGAISTQVLCEFYVVATRKFDPPIPLRTAREIVDAYSAWPTVTVDAALVLAASLLEEKHSLSFWDALIVEAARRAGATLLFTEDLQSGQRIAGITVQNPFEARR